LNASVNGAATDGGSVSDANYGGTSLFGTSGDISAGSSETVDLTFFKDSSGNPYSLGSGTAELDLSEATVRVVFQRGSDSSATLGKFEGPDA
jgi:hypothetical protein